MVNVPALTFDNFGSPLVRDTMRDFQFDASLVPSKNKSMNTKTKSEKYVDVLVPQGTTATKPLYERKKSAYAQQQQQVDDAIVPEFNSSYPQVQKFRPAPVVPDFDFLDMDDWTSPFDLDLDFDSILYEWDDQTVFNMPGRDFASHGTSAHQVTSISQHQHTSSDSESKESSEAEAAPQALADHQQSKPEEDEFTRNRRLCLERYREKKRNRKFSKKVRYHLRKMNADRRPRYKGRFIKKGEVIPPELLD